jgi:hypothetical protein
LRVRIRIFCLSLFLPPYCFIPSNSFPLISLSGCGRNIGGDAVQLWRHVLRLHLPRIRLS